VKKILLVADEPNWTFDYHCKEIQKRLTEFDIKIAYSRSGVVNSIASQYDLVYVLDPMPMVYPPANKTIMGLRCEFLYKEHPQGPQGLYEQGFPGRCVSIKDKCSIFHVVNRNQLAVFKPIVTDKPLLLAQHGVDEEIFDKRKYEKNVDGLVVSVSGRGSSNKGFKIVQKACEEMGIKMAGAHYGRRKLPKEKMPLFYNEATVHVCLSKTEGLNNPSIEAGSMGLPLVSTRCGSAEEIIVDGENGFLIDRNIDSLKEALIKLQDKDRRLEMGEKIYQEIMTNWTWKVRIEDFRKMFNMYFGG